MTGAVTSFSFGPSSVYFIHLFQFNLLNGLIKKKSEHICLSGFVSLVIKNVYVSRFDGRALLDFIRESRSRHFRAQEKSEEEEELEEFVNFERYRDLIKHRRRGCRYFF